MDEYNVTSAREYSMPSMASEYPQPPPETEYTPPAPELTAAELSRPAEPVRREGKKAASSGTRRKLIRYVAALAGTGVIVLEGLSPAEPPKEVVETDGLLQINSAVVLAEEPGVVLFQFYDMPYLGDEEESRFLRANPRYILVEPNGRETELQIRRDTVYGRTVQTQPDGEWDKMSYSTHAGDDWPYNMNLGRDIWRADIGNAPEGSSLKIVSEFEYVDLIRRSSAVREIDWLYAQPECTATARITPVGGGYAEAEFRAELRPQEGDDREYELGYSHMGFCTRWYDADRNYLGEGWFNAADASTGWHLPEIWKQGRNFILSYNGRVRCNASDSAAAYFSLEYVIGEENTGWYYIFESELFPIDNSEARAPKSKG